MLFVFVSAICVRRTRFYSTMRKRALRRSGVVKDGFLLERAYMGWGIPTFVLDKENRVLYRKCEEGIPVPMDAAGEVRKMWRENGMPVMWHETMDIIHMGFEDVDGDLCLFGPISIGNLSGAQIRDYQFTHKWKNSEAPLCRIPVSQAVSCLSTMYYLFTGRQVSEEVMTERMGEVRETAKEDAWDFMDDYDIFFGFEQEKSFIKNLSWVRCGLMRRPFWRTEEAWSL